MVKKLLFCLMLMMLVSGFAWAEKRIAVLEPTAVSISNDVVSGLSPTDGRGIDTLIYDSGSTTSGYYWAANYVMAMRMSPTGPCKILGGIFYSWSTSGTPTFLGDIFSWTGSAPGAQLGTGVSVPTSTTPTWRYADYAAQDINVTGDFLVGFHMQGATTVIGYEAANSGRCWDRSPAGAWTTWNETYFIRAVVEYSDVLVPDINCTPNPLAVNTATALQGIFQCKNEGDTVLDVTDITYAAAWIDSVVPDSFNVAIDDSVAVTVYFDTVGLAQGTYYDTLLIVSNDPDENPYKEAIELTVYDPAVGEGAELNIISVASTVKIFPNPAKSGTAVSFSLSRTAAITLDLYDALGRKVSNLVSGTFSGGIHDIVWNMKDEKGITVPQGIYFIQLKTDKIEAQEKLIITH